MKARITAMKAPWPQGAAVGDVVEFKGFDLIPDWALGKCQVVGDDQEAVGEVVFVAAPEAAPAPKLLSPVEVTEAIAALQATVAAQAEAIAALQAVKPADPLADAEAQAAAEKAKASGKGKAG